MKRISFILFIFLVPVQSVFADNLTELSAKEKELKVLHDSLRSAKNDKARNEWNLKFKTLLLETIELEGAFSYAFDSLSTIGKLRSPDNVFRLFNWNIENNDHSHYYQCLILIQGKKPKIFDCVDKSSTITKPDGKVLDPKMWYGCLYYKIIISQEKPHTTYTLLGWDINNELSSKKIIEALIIKGDKVTFGDPVFNVEGVGIKRRIVLEYNAQAQVTLKYNEPVYTIMFDHLIPEAPWADGLYEFYIPDGSYDGFELQEDGTWLYKPDVDARREKDEDDKLYNEPR
jgi:hypothetical protein